MPRAGQTGPTGPTGRRSVKKTRQAAISRVLWECIKNKSLTDAGRRLVFEAPHAARVMIQAEPKLREQVLEYLSGCGKMLESHARVNVDALIYLIERCDTILGYDKKQTFMLETQPGLLDQTRFALEARGHVLEADGVTITYPDDWPKDQSGEH